MEGVAPGPAAPCWDSPSRSSFQLHVRPLRVQLRNVTLVALARAVRSLMAAAGTLELPVHGCHALRGAPHRWPGQDTQGFHRRALPPLVGRIRISPSLSLPGIWPVFSTGPKPGSAGSLEPSAGRPSRCSGTRGRSAWSVTEPGASPLDLPGQTNHPTWSLEFPPSPWVLLEQQGLGWRRTADSGNFQGWDPGTKIFSKSRETFAQGWSFPSGPKALMAVVRTGSGLLWIFGSLEA